MTDPSLPAPPSFVPSDRLRSVALALEIPLGVFGAHRFYVGKVGTGILMCCTLGGCGLWWLYDLILVASGEFRDAQGRRLSQWSREAAEIMRRGSETPGGGVGAEEIAGMQSEIRELAERVDFLERMLAQVRERAELSSGRDAAEGQERRSASP